MNSSRLGERRLHVVGAEAVVVFLGDVEDELGGSFGVGDVGDLCERDDALEGVSGEEAHDGVEEVFVAEVDEALVGEGEPSHLGLLALVDLGQLAGPEEGFCVTARYRPFRAA